MTKSRSLIAVVDDERSVRVALQRLIRSSGMDVEIYPSGDQFLKAVETRPFACVVLDLHMPKMSGYEVLSRLAQLWIRIPALVMTGHDTPDARERALSTGAVAFLTKPIDERTLVDAIAKAVAIDGTHNLSDLGVVT